VLRTPYAANQSLCPVHHGTVDAQARTGWKKADIFCGANGTKYSDADAIPGCHILGTLRKLKLNYRQFQIPT
jgi:hypothetical protein